MAYLALDAATKCGWALWAPGMTKPAHGVFRLPPDADELGRPLEVLRSNLRDLHNLHGLTHIWYESPIVRHPNIKTIQKLCAMTGMIEWMSYKLDAHCRQVMQQSWRKYFFNIGTGKTEILKRAAIEACHLRGWEPADDNAADALGILEFMLTSLRVDFPWDVPVFFHQRRA